LREASLGCGSIILCGADEDEMVTLVLRFRGFSKNAPIPRLYFEIAVQAVAYLMSFVELGSVCVVGRQEEVKLMLEWTCGAQKPRQSLP
jgi:hypothetical protein